MSSSFIRVKRLFRETEEKFGSKQKTKKKKTKKRTREAIGRAPDHDARKSWTSIRRLLSFPFESLLNFFCTTRVPFDSNASRLTRANLH